MEDKLSKKDQIQHKIEEFFHPQFLEVIDDSAKHKGHQGVDGKKETHFRITVICNSFSSMSLIDRHRMIYNVIKKNFLGKGGIHSVSIKAYTEKEYLLF